ncbi:efflux RND transporter periplasmic adaptor subunit [Thalassotalea ponticola]|uniref:efflux RND transporter periplasmic adaptor subunit n=1 Tax=Thalassotalea ponticola TaxID=1523392 RepID=UPI0025B3AF15|nr:efflux RND transporter periplasmic adaptor subunit [Thalassotalea ponticola]MDN3653593.1 efflux RND transporter periplasmic adaptor subunit [Thalassotalea ponticola]
MTSTTEPNKSSKSHLKRNVFLVVIILAIGFFGFRLLKSMAPMPPKKPMDNKAPLVQAVDIVVDDVTFSVASQGTVKARTQTVLVSEVSGQVTFVSDKFRVGGFFSKDELMLEIDPSIYQVQLLQAQSRLESMQAAYIEEQARSEQAKQEWKLTGKPVEKAPILALRTPQLKKAQADVKAAEADLQEAQRKLNRTKIYAPYDALVVEKYIDIGQYVATSSQLAQTVAIDYAEVRLPIKQSDLRYLNLPKLNESGGSERAVTLLYGDGDNQQQWSSVIARYEGVVSNQSRVHYIVAQIDDPYNLINNQRNFEARIGMFVNAVIEGKTADNIAIIPREAVHGMNTVYVVSKDNTLQIKQVDIVRSTAEHLLVKNQFNQGDRLVMTRLRTPVQGMTVRVEGDDSADSNSDIEDNVNSQRSSAAETPSSIATSNDTRQTTKEAN